LEWSLALNTAQDRPGLLAGYGWMHVVGLTYCALVAVWSGGSYWEDELPGRAIVCVGAQALGLVLAILSRRALTSGAPVMGGLLWLPAAACCAVAALGIQHAWTRQGGDLLYALALAVAAVELVAFVAIDHVADKEAMARAARAQAARDAAQASEEAAAQAAHNRAIELARAVPGAAGPVAGGSVVRPMRRLAQAAGTSIAVVAGAAGAEPAAYVSSAQPGRPIDELARELIAQGYTTRGGLINAVRAATGGAGLGSQRAERLLDEHAPGWRNKRAA